jgi:osmotically-inducible protein OsmY
MRSVTPSKQQRKGVEAVASLGCPDPLEPSLAERIDRALRANGYPALRTIEVSAQDGRVVLKGRVPSYYMKQVAQATALTVAGVQELWNGVEVVPTAALVPTGPEAC